MEAFDVLVSALERELNKEDLTSVEIVTVILSVLAIVPSNEKAQLDGSMFHLGVWANAAHGMYGSFFSWMSTGTWKTGVQLV
jgi:hypothetical protein